MILSLLEIFAGTTEAVNALNKRVNELETAGPAKKTKALPPPLSWSREGLQGISHQLGLYEKNDFPLIDRRLDAFFRQRKYNLFGDFNSGTGHMGLERFLQFSQNRINLIKFLINNSRNKVTNEGITTALISRLFTVICDYKPDDELLLGIEDHPALTKVSELLNKIYEAPKLSDAYADIGLLYANLTRVSDDEILSGDEIDHFLFNITLDHALSEAKLREANTRTFRSILSKHFTRFEDIRTNFLNQDFNFERFQKLSIEGKALDSIEIVNQLNEYMSEEMEHQADHFNGEFSQFLDMNGKDAKALFKVLQDPLKTKDLLKHMFLNSSTESSSNADKAFVLIGTDEEDPSLKTGDKEETVQTMLPKVFSLATNRTYNPKQDDNGFDLLSEIIEPKYQSQLFDTAIEFLRPSVVVSQVWRDIQINLKPILALLLYKSVDTTEDHKLEMNEAGLKTLSGFIAKYHQYQAKITAYKNRD